MIYRVFIVAAAAGVEPVRVRDHLPPDSKLVVRVGFVPATHLIRLSAHASVAFTSPRIGPPIEHAVQMPYATAIGSALSSLCACLHCREGQAFRNGDKKPSIDGVARVLGIAWRALALRKKNDEPGTSSRSVLFKLRLAALAIGSSSCGSAYRN